MLSCTHGTHAHCGAYDDVSRIHAGFTAARIRREHERRCCTPRPRHLAYIVQLDALSIYFSHIALASVAALAFAVSLAVRRRSAAASMAAPARYKRIGHGEVLRAVSEGDRSLLVIDVRDDDFARGNLRGAWNYPSRRFDDDVDGLVERVAGAARAVEPSTLRVAFHCMYSQERGPRCAAKFAEAWVEAGAPCANVEVRLLTGGFSGARAHRDAYPDAFDGLK